MFSLLPSVNIRKSVFNFSKKKSTMKCWHCILSAFTFLVFMYYMHEKCGSVNRVVKHNIILSNDEYHLAFHNYIAMQNEIRLNKTSCWKIFAYLSEFAALNGLLRREFFRLTLLLRLNDIRLKNWRKSKLRIVSMVDCLKKLRQISCE